MCPRDDPRPIRTSRPPGSLAARVTAERLRRGLTQQQLADLLGVGVASIRRWETGAEPRGLSLRAIEAFLTGEV